MTWQKEFRQYLKKRFVEKGYFCKNEFYLEAGGRVDLLVLYPIPEPFHYVQVAAIEIEESHSKWVRVTTNLDKLLTSANINPQVIIHIFRKHLPPHKQAVLETISGTKPLIVVNGIDNFPLCADRVFLELNRIFKYNEEISSLLRIKVEEKTFDRDLEIMFFILTNFSERRIAEKCLPRKWKTLDQLVKETGLKELDVCEAIHNLCSLSVLSKKMKRTEKGFVAEFMLKRAVARSLVKIMEGAT